MRKLFGALVLLPLVANAQQDSSDTPQKKFIRVVSFSAFGGGDIYKDGFEDRTIFQQAAPSSTLAFADLAGYSNPQQFYYLTPAQTSTSAGINLNLHLRCQQKYGEVRVGFMHSNTTVSSQYYWQENTTQIAVDTLSNGSIFYTDSIATSSYGYNWTTDVLHLNLAWVVHTDARRWVNLYTGIGLNAGVGYNGVITANHVHNSHQSTYSQNNGNGYLYTDNYITEVLTTEKFRAPSLTSFGAYVPIGMNIRLGRRNEFLKHLTLFGEYNGGIQVIAPKNVDTKIRTVSSMYGGVRWYIHAPASGNKRGRGKHEHNRDQQQFQRGYGMVH